MLPSFLPPLIENLFCVSPDLVSKLQELRTGGECMEGIGDTILQWVSVHVHTCIYALKFTCNCLLLLGISDGLRGLAHCSSVGKSSYM